MTNSPDLGPEPFPIANSFLQDNPMKLEHIKSSVPTASGRLRIAGVAALILTIFLPARAQNAPAPATSPSTQQEKEDAYIELSPFVVKSEEDTGYVATTTLAGTRLRTNLSDIGTSVSVLTSEFLSDIGATDSQTALSYALNTEVGGLSGNYQNAPNTGSWGQTSETNAHMAPNNNTRVRGLVSADNTLNYFRTSVAWDGYNVDRIDMLRGANSILFGLGSPGGVINASTRTANVVRDGGEADITTDEYGSFRSSLDYNKVILKNQLALRLGLLRDNQKYGQKPAFDNEDRIFVTGKYRPAFFNRNGVTLEIVADFQRGEGNSNRPRTAPPLDWLSAWIEPVSTQPIQLPAGTNFNGYANGVIPSFTQFSDRTGVTFLDIVARRFPSSIRQMADAFGPTLTVNSVEPGGDYWRQGRAWVEGALLANGTQYFGNPQASRRIFGLGDAYMHTPLMTFGAYLNEQGHPFGTAFSPLQITDPSVFNFYDKLLDGPNKEEWSDFNQHRIVLANTFLHGKLGYELSYFSEDAKRGQTTYLSDVTRIFVDMQLENIEGKPNPNFGRPYVQETSFGGNRLNETEIEGFRASAYFDHNFKRRDRSSWWRTLLGRHVFNGAYSVDKSFTKSRGFERVVLGPEFIEASPSNPLFHNRTRVSTRYYLGDSLAGRTSAAGANISNLDRYVIPEGGKINLRYFDTTWNAPTSVNPAAPWVNPAGQTWEQAANPANYVGWTQGDYSIINALSGNPADLDYATRGATLDKNDVKSRILTWQGYFFDGLVVGTYGWREDDSMSARLNSDSYPEPYNNAILDPAVFNLANPKTARGNLTVQSRNYSAVVHLHKIPKFGRRLPINVSFSYNEGANFDPSSADRRDVNGVFIDPPKGETKEYGLLLSTQDNRYSLRIINYETAVTNATSSQIRNIHHFNQFLAEVPRETITDIESGDMRIAYEARPEKPAWSIDDQENIHGPAWRQFERDFAAAFPGFVPTWLATGSWAPMNKQTSFRNSFLSTENNVSKGWELEFTANPTRSLRLTLNASKTEAVRTDVPGASTRSLYEYLQKAMVNPDGTPTAAGGLRSSYNWNDTMADFWTMNNYSNYELLQRLNGQSAPELVEWRVNAVANYTFQEGRLRNFGIGGAMRYEGGATIGFPYFFDDLGNPVADVENPYRRGSNERFDLWLSYRKKLFDNKIDWSIRLNLSNIFNDDELIPVRANPDGTLANFRIQQGRTWRLSSSFRF